MLVPEMHGPSVKVCCQTVFFTPQFLEIFGKFKLDQDKHTLYFLVNKARSELCGCKSKSKLMHKEILLYEKQTNSDCNQHLIQTSVQITPPAMKRQIALRLECFYAFIHKNEVDKYRGHKFHLDFTQKEKKGKKTSVQYNSFYVHYLSS